MFGHKIRRKENLLYGWLIHSLHTVFAPALHAAVKILVSWCKCYDLWVPKWRSLFSCNKCHSEWTDDGYFSFFPNLNKYKDNIKIVLTYSSNYENKPESCLTWVTRLRRQTLKFKTRKCFKFVTTLSVVVYRFLNPLVGYRCGLLWEKFPDLNAFCVNINSLAATKYYRTFTDHRSNQKPSLNCKEATDLFLDKNLSPCQQKARLRELLKGKLTTDEPVSLRKVQEKISRNQESSCEKRIHWTLQAHIQNLSFSSKGNCTVFRPLSFIT